ncbi:MAG: aminoacyl-tRNA hydrolase [Clostridia bacterium]|nr:aminoacyl-tRNA hydrolase [Clostridia bacterium]
MYLIVGLGNPGKKYDNTFHNSGFLAIDELADRLDVSFGKKITCKAVLAEGFVGGEKVILAKPQTYMNLSGESVRELVAYYKLPLSNLMVFYDDYDLPLGALRIRPHGSAGTHNGMRSIVKELGSTEFARVRIGIKPPEQLVPIMDYVLADRSRSAREAMAPALDKAARAGEAFARGESMDKIGCAYNVNL